MTGKRLLLLLSSIFLAVSAYAQTAEIRVDVTDATGSVIVGAKVNVRNTETGLTQALTTDQSGLSRAAALPPGPYEVVTAMEGFSNDRSAINLTVGQIGELHVRLAAGSDTQTISVEASAPGLAVETSTTTVSGVITRQQLLDLPVINRSFIALAQLLPGGAPSLSGDARFGTQTAVGGSNVRSGYSTLVDGASLDHPIYGFSIVDVNQDSVREFRVLRNQFDAEYGRAGTAVVDVVTRSGTNKYDALFNYFGRRDALNARNYFNSGNQPPFSLNRYSTAVGGPVVRDRTHFFVADEYIKQTSAYYQALAASNPFASQVNGTYPNNTTEKTLQAKLDHQINEKNSGYLRYLWEQQDINETYAYNDNYSIAFHDVMGQWSHIFTPSMLNSFQLEFLDQNTYRFILAQGAQQVRPSFTLGAQPNKPQGYPRKRVGLNDTFYITKGRNTIKLGTRLTYEVLHFDSNYYGQGVWNFNTDAAFDINNSATWPTRLTIGSGFSTKVYKNSEQSYFIQDDVKLSPRLTMNAGLRYDFETDLRSQRYVAHLLNNSAYAGLSNYVSADRGNDWNNVQPRVGFAYDLMGKGTTVLRAAYGGYSVRNRPFFNMQGQTVTDNFTVQISDPNLLKYYPNTTAVLGGLSLQQYVALQGGRLIYLPGDHLNIPYVHELTAGVQHGFGRNSVLVVDFVRQIQTGLQTGHDANLPAIGPLNSAHPRPLKQFSTVTLFDSTTTSWNTALQVQFRTRYRRASVQTSYALGKVVSDGLNDNTAAPSDPFHLMGNADRGLDELDRRQVLTVAPMFYFPWGIQISGVAAVLTTTPFNITYGRDLDGDGNTSDRPAGLTKFAGGHANQHNLDLINAARTLKTATSFNGVTLPALNLSPVTMSQLAQGSGGSRVDVRGAKEFSFREVFKVNLFAEAYNIFNTPVFNAPTATISSTAFLTRSSAADPRQLQFGVRVTWNNR
ncbi:TonB-dependent receptor [Terriglobus albidus]|uniref:TonB-dependent receptor n=1 Tax=Terriglobus albidus TaxID=1592106 RepID=UPI00164D3603|nr:carboxypeptidase regulatory-like domain-containing protein [Terriglobus albidus]